MGRKIPIVDNKKLCTRCDTVKDLDLFCFYTRYKANGEKQTCYSWCKSCGNDYKKELNSRSHVRRQYGVSRENKLNAVIKIKDNPCVDCGNKFPPVVMDFDHVRGEKITNITKMIYQSHSMETLLKEIKKCDLVCANCHRIRTSGRPKPWLTKLRISRKRGGSCVRHIQSNQVFLSAAEAARHFDVSAKGICEVLRNKNHSIGGHKFVWIRDPDEIKRLIESGELKLLA